MIWKFASWNVNGLRAITRKGLLQPFLKSTKVDILCLQEVKIDDARRAKENFDFPNYREYFNCAKKPGYSGTATLVSEKLTQPKIMNGLNVRPARPDSHSGGRSEEFDSEGRVQTLEFEKFFLVNAYFPNSREDLSRLDFKIDFNNLLLKHIKKLDKKKPVILTGDYNVAHQEMDLARPKENEGKHGYHPRERQWMSKLLDAGFIDTFRYLHPDKAQYSWWATRFGKSIRERNIGWRIYYFVVSKRLASRIKSANILDQALGSDHCPVSLAIDF